MMSLQLNPKFNEFEEPLLNKRLATSRGGGLKSVMEACEAFKTAVKHKNIPLGLKLMDDLKEMVLNFELQSMLGTSGSHSSDLIEKQITRDFYECAVIFSVDRADAESFERYVECLRPIYASERQWFDSDLMSTIIGLNLLHLLVEDKLPQFHCELEFLSEEQREHPAIVFSIALDQFLMAGAYDQVLLAAANPPIERFRFFLKSLMRTVRGHIVQCISATYGETLRLEAAQERLMFDSVEETIEYIQTSCPGWRITPQRVISLRSGKTEAQTVPAKRVIKHALFYAAELDRIV